MPGKTRNNRKTTARTFSKKGGKTRTADAPIKESKKGFTFGGKKEAPKNGGKTRKATVDHAEAYLKAFPEIAEAMEADPETALGFLTTNKNLRYATYKMAEAIGLEGFRTLGAGNDFTGGLMESRGAFDREAWAEADEATRQALIARLEE